MTSTNKLLKILGISTLLSLLVAGSAMAGNASPCSPLEGSRNSAVLSNTFDQGNGNFSYNFTICNLSSPFGNDDGGRVDLIRDWELPWDPAANITNIRVPNGWDWTIEKRGVENPTTGWEGIIEWQDPNDPFYDPRYEFHTQVLHFYTGCGSFETAATLATVGQNPQPTNCLVLPEDWIPPGDLRSGFGFDAPLSPTNSPYQASWVQQPVRTGDPDFPPVGTAVTPGFLATPVPEPSSIALVALGLLAAARVRRQTVQVKR